MGIVFHPLTQSSHTEPSIWLCSWRKTTSTSLLLAWGLPRSTPSCSTDHLVEWRIIVLVKQALLTHELPGKPSMYQRRSLVLLSQIDTLRPIPFWQDCDSLHLTSTKVRFWMLETRQWISTSVLELPIQQWEWCASPFHNSIMEKCFRCPRLFFGSFDSIKFRTTLETNENIKRQLSFSSSTHGISTQQSTTTTRTWYTWC